MEASFLPQDLCLEDFLLSHDQLRHAPGDGYGDGSFPAIDLSQSDSHLVPLVHSAASSWGFFRVYNHSIPQSLIDKISCHSLRFFQLPLQQKLGVLRTSVLPLGYIGSSQNAPIKAWSEALNVMPGAGRLRDLMERIWPCDEEREEIRADLDEYLNRMRNLAHRILGILFCGLGVDPDGVTRLFEANDSSFLRMNYYPPCPAADSTWGLPPHKDYGGLAILYQDDVGGLQVMKNGQWVGVKPEKGYLVVNVGDIIQVLSNEKYKSVLHRSLVNSQEPRLSLVFFYNPSEGTMISPIEGTMTSNEPRKYRPFLWEEYRSTFQKAKFGNHSPTQFFQVINP